MRIHHPFLAVLLACSLHVFAAELPTDKPLIADGIHAFEIGGEAVEAMTWTVQDSAVTVERAGWNARVTASHAGPAPLVDFIATGALTDGRTCELRIVAFLDQRHGSLIPLLAEENAVATVTLEAIDSTVLHVRQPVPVATNAAESAAATAARAEATDRAFLWVDENRARIQSTSLLQAAGEHFWHHSELDLPPGSFNRILRLNERILELDPHATQTYTSSAWLWWSKWVTWTQKPDAMPDGEVGVVRALNLLARGAKANATDAAYLYDAGVTLYPLAKFHRPELLPTVLDYLQQADAAGADSPLRLRVRIRLQLGNILRENGQPAAATDWYRRVLELDPENEVATRYLKALEKDAVPGAPRTDNSVAPPALDSAAPQTQPAE